VADFRYSTDADLEKAKQKISEVANTVYVPGCSCTYEQVSYRVGMPVLQRNLDLLDKINNILSAEGQPTLAAKKRYSGSDAADVSAADIPCLDSMGPSGGGAHSKNEFAWLHSMADAVKRVALIVSRI
jgi:glutamate carboxypeptidase